MPIKKIDSNVPIVETNFREHDVGQYGWTYPRLYLAVVAIYIQQ